ncbi:hypothetical protein H0H93_011795, partial [Arthromyces matolae]
WLNLCKMLMSKTLSPQLPESVQVDLSNSVLVLCRSYPGDPDLQHYLKHAIHDGALPISAFVYTLLQAARSSELHAPSTLDMLCRVALDAHYSSGLAPIGSVVSYEESTAKVLGIVQDALALLRTAHTLPLSPFHRLTTSASELVILLLSCVSDISQVSTAQAMVYFADANDLLQNFQLATDVRQVLETFVLSLSLSIGDDANAAREAHMLHSIPFTLGKGSLHGSGSETDIVTFSLFLHHIVSYKTRQFGAGDSQGTVAVLVALFRWAAWSPVVFYTQLFLAAFTCLSQSGSKALIWKAFVIGRLTCPKQLPHLLHMFETVVNAEGVTSSDWVRSVINDEVSFHNGDQKRAMQSALQTNFKRTELISQCDQAITLARRANLIHEDDLLRSFSRDLLQNCVYLDQVTVALGLIIDPSIQNDNFPRLQTEARETGLDVETYLESKLSSDISLEELAPWISRIISDDSSDNVFAAVIIRRFTSLAAAYDVDALGDLCRLLYTIEAVLEIVALHVKLSELILSGISFLDKYDCETVGDPQAALGHLGNVVIFVQHTAVRFHLEVDLYAPGIRVLCSTFLRPTDIIYPIDSLSNEDGQAFAVWFKALFDNSSEGIEDNILRTTQPKVLLRISATLVFHAIKAHTQQKIDKETLMNGITYFVGPLLNWTLSGIIKALAREIMQQRMYAFIVLILSKQSHPTFQPRRDSSRGTTIAGDVSFLPSSCIATLCAEAVQPSGFQKGQNEYIDDAWDRLAFYEAHSSAQLVVPPVISRHVWEEEPRQLIQTALNMARAGKAPFLDVAHCIKIVPPTTFLQLLWAELVIFASVGETETSRRIASFVLTMPQSSDVLPLLPIFLHVVTPSIIFTMNHQQTPDHMTKIELLVTTISSALTAALHLELGIRSSMSGEHRFVLGQPSSGMARKLAADLRESGDPTSRLVLQKLASSQSFAANFAVSINELG